MFRVVMDDPILQAEIIDLNTTQQMYEKGVDAKGDPLGQYAPITIAYYKPLAAAEGRDGRTDHITLKDTGDFYGSFKTRTTNDGLVISAETVKEGKDLLVPYPNIIGLTDESLAEIRPAVLQGFQEQTKEALVRGVF